MIPRLMARPIWVGPFSNSRPLKGSANKIRGQGMRCIRDHIIVLISDFKILSEKFVASPARGASFLRFEIQAQNWLTDIGPNGLVKALVLGGLGSLRLSLF